MPEDLLSCYGGGAGLPLRCDGDEPRQGRVLGPVERSRRWHGHHAGRGELVEQHDEDAAAPGGGSAGRVGFVQQAPEVHQGGAGGGAGAQGGGERQGTAPPPPLRAPGPPARRAGRGAGAPAPRTGRRGGAATRLALREALSAAAGEITRDLAPGSVDVRLRGRDLDFVVTPPPADKATMRGAGSPEAGADVAGPPLPPPPDAEDGGTSRITLRMPEHLKPRIDQAAGRAGLSVNAWLVRAVAAALDAEGGPRHAEQHDGRRYTGWVR